MAVLGSHGGWRVQLFGEGGICFGLFWGREDGNRLWAISGSNNWKLQNVFYWKHLKNVFSKCKKDALFRWNPPTFQKITLKKVFLRVSLFFLFVFFSKKQTTCFFLKKRKHGFCLFEKIRQPCLGQRKCLNTKIFDFLIFRPTHRQFNLTPPPNWLICLKAKFGKVEKTALKMPRPVRQWGEGKFWPLALKEGRHFEGGKVLRRH